MLTTCPSCHTTFKVTREQLEAHHGDVRCGRCSTIFNGNIYLAKEPHTVLSGAATASPPPSVAQTAPADATPIEAKPTPGASPASLTETSSKAAGLVAPPMNLSTELLYGAQSSSSQPVALPKSRRAILIYAMGSALLTFLLAVQIAYFFRDAIAARVGPAKPALTAMCAVLRCTVGLPREPDKIVIESSDLQAGARPGIMIFSALLRSKANHPIAYPLLDLALTDTEDAAVARRILTPAQYLRAGSVVAEGLAARGEVALRLTLDIGDLRASGYRIYAFYPER